MQRTRAQIQLQYYQTLNRIAEMEVLAEQLTKLAESYRKEQQGKQLTFREEESIYCGEEKEDGPGKTLQAQANDLKSAAEDWYRRAREEYHASIQEIRLDEERKRAW